MYFNLKKTQFIIVINLNNHYFKNCAKFKEKISIIVNVLEVKKILLTQKMFIMDLYSCTTDNLICYQSALILNYLSVVALLDNLVRD